MDELIGQLTDRAQDVLAAQGRLRGLLRANAAVAGELNLPVVLRHVVQAARDLVRARYGALGVIGPDGRLEQFVHVGMDPDQVDRIGHLPTGQGLLGALIQRPEPVRLTDLRAHPDAAGFPDQHPPMTSFLGVPIRVHGQVFGNLYLTDSANGEFTAEDEQLVTALAGTAGTAIANARLHQEAVDQRRWLDASSKLTQQLFARTAERTVGCPGAVRDAGGGRRHGQLHRTGDRAHRPRAGRRRRPGRPGRRHRGPGPDPGRPGHPLRETGARRALRRRVSAPTAWTTCPTASAPSSRYRCSDRTAPCVARWSSRTPRTWPTSP